MDTGSDEAGVVGHVDHQLGSDFASDVSELGVVDLARVGACAGDDQFRLVLASERGDLVEVDAMISLAHTVRDDLVKLA